MTIQEFNQLKSDGKLLYHHSSIARGYVCVGCSWIYDYCGRFGKGVVVNEETLHSSIRGNSHHFIHYYIYNV